MARARAQLAPLIEARRGPDDGSRAGQPEADAAEAALRAQEDALERRLANQERRAALVKQLSNAGGGAGRAAQEIDLAGDIIEEFGQRFGGTFDFASARIEDWRATTLASLEAAGLGHTELADMVDEIARDRLAEAYQEDLRNRDDWAAGVERGLGDISGAQRTMADIAEDTVKTAFSSMEDAFVSLARTGKIETADLVDFALRQLFRLAAQAAVFNVTGQGALGGLFGGIAGNLFSLFSGPAPGSTADILHEGGIAGRDGRARPVDPSVFTGAKRLHIGGLARDEVPAILEEDERVLTLAQQQSTAETIRGLAALAASPGRALPPSGAAPVINVNLIGAPAQARVSQPRQNGDGSFDLDIVFEQMEERLAGNISRGRGIAPAIGNRFNLRGRL